MTIANTRFIIQSLLHIISFTINDTDLAAAPSSMHATYSIKLRPMATDHPVQLEAMCVRTRLCLMSDCYESN